MRPGPRVKVSMAIENLFDRDYSEPGSLAIIGANGLPTFVPQPGISAILGVDAHF